jgi:tRNA(fMet)-specific endonuclease VapC
VPIISFDLAQARLFAVRFAELAGRGEVIGDRDLQIAATALSLDYEMATLNAREFKRVTGLRLVDITGYTVA